MQCEALMVQATLRMTLPPGRLREALGMLIPMADRIRVDSACLGCHVYQDAQEDCVLMLEERWRSEEDLERHLRSIDYRNVLLLMEMALEAPEVMFNTILRSSGMEAIAKARRVTFDGSQV
jgi:quinol monooxygenase YgiN